MALMRDETSARTEKPTPLRIAEARQRGQVARSADMVSVALLLGGLEGIALWGDDLLVALTAMLANSRFGKSDTFLETPPEFPRGTWPSPSLSRKERENEDEVIFLAPLGDEMEVFAIPRLRFGLRCS